MSRWRRARRWRSSMRRGTGCSAFRRGGERYFFVILGGLCGFVVFVHHQGTKDTKGREGASRAERRAGDAGIRASKKKGRRFGRRGDTEARVPAVVASSAPRGEVFHSLGRLGRWRAGCVFTQVRCVFPPL